MRAITTLVLFSFIVAVSTQAATVAQIEAQGAGTLVTLDSNPVITVIGSAPGTGDGYTYTNYAILAADSTGSIDLFGRLPSGSTYVPAVGDSISVSGTYSPFDAIPEIATLTAIAKTASNNPVPAPIPVTVTQLAGIDSSSFNLLGHYLSLQNVLFQSAAGSFPVHANGTYTVTGLSGENPLTVYQWASSYSTAGALGGTPVPAGPVNINGIVDLFDGAPEFIPFSISPAATTATPEPAGTGLILVGLATVALKLKRRDMGL